MNLKIGHWNVHGLLESMNDALFHEIVSKFHIFACVETWLSPHRLGEIQCIENFTHFSSAGVKYTDNNRGRYSGGITVFIHKDVCAGAKLLEINEYYAWFRLNKNDFGTEEDIYICFLYIPPDGSSAYSVTDLNAFNVLEDTYQKYSRKGGVLLMGDFNARTGYLEDSDTDDRHTMFNALQGQLSDIPSWESLRSRHNRDDQVNLFGKKLIDFCKSFECRIVNGRISGDLLGQFTCHKFNGSSLVDYTVADKQVFQKISSLYVSSPNHLSDHSYLSLHMNINAEPKSSQPNNGKQMHTGLVLPSSFVWDNSHKENFLEALSLPHFQSEIQSILSDSIIDPSEAVLKLSAILQNVARLSLNRRRKRKNHKPHKLGFDRECIYLKREVISLGKMLGKRPNDPFIRGQFMIKKKQFKKLVKSKNRMAKVALMNKLATLASADPKGYWSLIRKLRKNQHEDQIDDVSSWYDHFNGLLNNIALSKGDDYDEQFYQAMSTKLDSVLAKGSRESDCPVLDSQISCEEVNKVIKKMKCGKASGNDMILNEMIKCAIPHISLVITKICNLIMNTESYPNTWGTGVITPIHKSGSRSVLDNYRGITVSSCLSKVFTGVLNDRLSTFLTNNKIISDNQIGFRPKFRTSDHIFVLSSIIKEFKRRHRPLYACFIDLSKAYDRVNHSCLYFKLLKSGVSSKFVRIVKDIYDKSFSCVKVENKLSDTFKLNIGLRQGCILSPALFNIFINDLPQYLASPDTKPVIFNGRIISSLLFADDLLILSESLSGLQRATDKMSAFCQRWRLQINVNKTKAICFNKRLTDNLTLKLGNFHIEFVKQVKYLGILLSSNGSFSQAESALGVKGKQALYQINKSFSVWEGTQVKTMLNLFDSVVKPQLLYGAEIWGAYLYRKPTLDGILKSMFSSKFKCEAVHIKFCKSVLGVSRRTCNVAALSELGRVPLLFNIFISILKFISHVLRDSNPLAKLALEAEFSNYKHGVPSFFSLVSVILKLVGSKLNGLEAFDSSFIHDVKSVLKTKMENECISSLKRKSKLDLYSSLKVNFGREMYLDTVGNLQSRRSITKVRLSDHDFEIEVGRRCNKARDDRICRLCASGEVGTEFHVLMNCTNQRIIELREKFIQNIYDINLTFQNLNTTDLYTYYCLLVNDDIDPKEVNHD